MAGHRRRAAELSLSAISVEGALIAPAEIARIIATPADQKTANDYGCPKGTSLKDEVARYFRIGQAHWQAFARIEQPTIQQVAEFARTQLEEVFGFEGLKGSVEHQQDGHRYRISWEAKGGRVPIVCAAPVSPDDAFKRPLPEFGDGSIGPLSRRTPTTLLQEWLNAHEGSLWGLVFAGDRLRLMRDNLSLTRPAWIEADLGAIYRDEIFSEFTALWLLIHDSRFGSEDAAPTDSSLEHWREGGLRAGTAVRERLRGSVEEALELLGQGFLDANSELRDRLASGELAVTSWFEQLLRLVYRLIFLAVAEDRDLLHAPDAKPDAKALYADNYSFGWLRDRSARQSGRDRHQDAYEGIKIVFRGLIHGEPLLGLPSLGGLFAPGLTPDLDNSTLENRAFLSAVFRLAWLMGQHGRERINWRDMATEEFGSVYEGLLELVPVIQGGTNFAFAGGVEAKGNARKVSGSYYTPDSLVQTLLDSTLDPVLDRAEAQGGAEAILSLNIIDPACGSGHFLLGAARRIANRVAQIRDPDAPDFQAAMRDVVRRCVHGVDRNPMAVELAKVALWIEAIEPGKPLGFLDANIRCGDSLLGIFDLAALEGGIPDDAYKPLTGDDKTTAKFYAAKNKSEKKGQGSFDWTRGGGSLPPARIAATLEDVLALPEDTVEQVEAKRKKFWAWADDPRRQNTKVACELYVAAFLVPKTDGPPANPNMGLVPTTADIRTKLAGGNIFGPREAAAIDAATEARAFHWPLAFPDVMIAKGGFDVVLGNPPWERIKLQEQEFFANRAPEIAAAANAAARGTLIKALADAPEDSSERRLHEAFQLAKRIAEASSLFFTAPKEEDPVKGVIPSAARRYPWTGRGDVNTYALFAEHFLNLARPEGRSGAIVPTGIATDATTAPFFDHLVSGRRLVGLIDFENREALFPAVDSRMKFCLLTMGGETDAGEFAFVLTDPAQLEDPRRRFTLTPEDISRINPNTRVAPVFRSRADAELTASIYSRVPVLADERLGPAGNNWGAYYIRLVDYGDHAAELYTARQAADAGFCQDGFIWVKQGSRLLPVYESKYVNAFDHRYAGATLDGGITYSGEERSPTTEFFPRYWVREEFFLEILARSAQGREWLLAYRDIARADDNRTLIPVAIPKMPAARNLPVLGFGQKHCGALLLANMGALVTDHVARQSLTGAHMTFSIVKQLPILPPRAYREDDLAFILPRVLELSYTSWSMQPFARELGHDGAPFAWNESRRALLRAELDAFFALAYGLSRGELRYVLDPKEVMGADYPSETFRVLQNNERKKYGEYRTARLVLAAYDKMIAEGARPRIEGCRQ